MIEQLATGNLIEQGGGIGGGKGGNSVITLTPVVLNSQAETIVAIFAINTVGQNPSLNRGWWQTGFSDIANQATVYTAIGMDVLALTNKSGQTSITLNFDASHFDSSNYNVVGAIELANTTIYVTTIGSTVYGIATMLAAGMSGYQLQTQFESQLTTTNATLQQTWVGSTLAAFIAAKIGTTPVAPTKQAITAGLNETVNTLGVNFNYSTNSFPIDYAFLDSNGTNVLNLPATAGNIFQSAGVKYTNGLYITYGAPQAFLVSTTGAQGTWNTISASGINDGDRVSDITFFGGYYYCVTLGGAAYKSQTLTNWTLVDLVTPFTAINSIDTNGTLMVAVCQNGNVYTSNGTNLTLVNMPSSNPIAYFNQVRYSATGKSQITGKQYTGNFCAVGYDTTNRALVMYSPDGVLWAQQVVIVSNQNPINSVMFDGLQWGFCGDATSTWVINMLIDSGQSISTGAFPGGAGNLSLMTTDGVNDYLVGGEGTLWQCPRNNFQSASWNKVGSITNTQIKAVCSNGTSTVIAGYATALLDRYKVGVIGASTIAYNPTNAAVNFTTFVINTYQIRATMPFVNDRDNRYAVVGDIFLPPVNSNAVQLDYAATNLRIIPMTQSTVFTFANISAGSRVYAEIQSSGAFTATFPSNVKWVGGKQPVQTSGGTDLYTFVYDGINYLGSVKQGYA